MNGRLAALLVVAPLASQPTFGESCPGALANLDIGAQIWATYGLTASGSLDPADLPVASIMFDEFVKPNSINAKTDFEPDGAHITIYVRSIGTDYKALLKNAQAFCPNGEPMVSWTGVGLVIPSLMHELFHACFGQTGANSLNPFSCEHLAIDFAVHSATCELVKWLKILLNDAGDPVSIEEYEGLIAGLCARVGSIEAKLSGDEAVDAVQDCVSGCDPDATDPPDGFYPGGKPGPGETYACGNAWIPCTASGYPNDEVPSCGACD